VIGVIIKQVSSYCIPYTLILNLISHRVNIHAIMKPRISGKLSSSDPNKDHLADMTSSINEKPTVGSDEASVDNDVEIVFSESHADVQVVPTTGKRRVGLIVGVGCLVLLAVTVAVVVVVVSKSFAGSSGDSSSSSDDFDFTDVGPDFSNLDTEDGTPFPSTLSVIAPSSPSFTSNPTVSLTKTFTNGPTIHPAYIPTTHQTNIASESPSKQPTTLNPTRLPTMNTPDIPPTPRPTFAPITPIDPSSTTLTTFCVIADVPYFTIEETELQAQIANQMEGCEFLIHLGVSILCILLIYFLLYSFGGQRLTHFLLKLPISFYRILWLLLICATQINSPALKEFC
jgi:hypothetical protein